MVTIKDIAEATGVSATTVSNVIHGRDNRVSAETIEKINETIQKLGYTPNMSARSLVSSSSKVIVFINHAIPGTDRNFMEDPFHSLFIGILEQKLRENGYFLMLRTVESADELVSFLRNWNADGLFFTGVLEDTFLKTLNSVKIPVVLIDGYIANNKICNVGLEDFNGCYTSTKYLIDKGHKRIAFAAPPIKASGVVKERYNGYRKALEDASIAFDPTLVIESEMDYNSCKNVCDRLNAMPDVTALVTTADIMAANVITHLRAAGKSIPNDISIIGFDDIALSRLIYPPLTTIHQDFNQKGTCAVDMMLQKLEGESPQSSQIILPTKLIERESVRSV